MPRAVVLLLDSFGIGASLDAKKFGDEGADTFGHIHEACYQTSKHLDAIQKNSLSIPVLTSLGLYHAHLASTGKRLAQVNYEIEPKALFGYAVEQSNGKDTPSGHWEIAGVPVRFDWGYFPNQTPSFPISLIDDFINQAHLSGILGNCHASGTTIIETLGEEHIRTGKPIVYTSADSVFQIAAHEHYFGLERLYQICKIARSLVDRYNVGRVIARPFIGEPGAFKRTPNRKDYSTPPPAPTLLDHMLKQHIEVIGIGKTGDIFAHQGFSREIKAPDNMALFDATLNVLRENHPNQFIFTNFVDFDSQFGHRRDIVGYANALEEFDKRLPEIINILRDDDIIIMTSDHGCDPSFPGSDHTREHIPVLVYGPKIVPQFIGRRDSFADIGQSIARWFNMNLLDEGCSFL